ncbi:zinc finger protein 629-like [Sycon ciliatum]|uniref:zinc finger protein 629-like n=1 Tax=Sycon ciliatum TaxID=27933 RepID=UPI0031F6AF34
MARGYIPPCTSRSSIPAFRPSPISPGFGVQSATSFPAGYTQEWRRAQSYVRDSHDRSRQDNMLRLTEERRSMYRGDQTPKTIRSARELSQPRLDDNWHETVPSINNMATMYVATAGMGVATTDQKAVPSSADVMCRLNWHSPSSSIGKPHQEPVSTSISKMSVTPHQTEPPAGYSKPTADHPTTGGKTGSLFQDTEYAKYYPTADTCSAFSYHLGQSSASSQRPAASHDDLIRHRPSASPSDHQLASPKTYGETHKDQRYEATFDAPPNMENKMESDFRFSGEEYRESLVETLQKAGKKGCPDRSSNVGVSQEGMPETSEEPSAYRIPMDCGHPAGHQSVPSKVTTMRRDQEPRTTYTTLYRCAFCPKEFKKPYQLREHDCVHTGERPFKCDVCSKSFNRRWTLDIHRRIHSGRREYTCKECGKSFTQSCHLRVHERIHSGQRQHMCKECGKSFTQSCHLRVHERRHTCTDERPFTCKLCDMSFRQKSHLRLHNIRVHAAERPDM